MCVRVCGWVVLFVGVHESAQGVLQKRWKQNQQSSTGLWFRVGRWGCGSCLIACLLLCRCARGAIAPQQLIIDL
jgi:hypothetical protein